MGTLTAAIRRHTINLCAYTSVPYRAAQMLNQLRRGHRPWPMFELKSGAAMAAPAAPMPPPLSCLPTEWLPWLHDFIIWYQLIWYQLPSQWRI